jgi:hypothetical protein
MIPTLANAGLPMIFVHGPVFIMGFIPIVIIEAFILRRFIDKPTAIECLKATTVANLVSTVIGLPLTWIVFVIIQMLADGGGHMPNSTSAERIYAAILQSPWQLPYNHHSGWMIPRAALIMLVPFFIVSYQTERFVVQQYMKLHDRTLIRKGVYWGNVTSYTCLAIFWTAIVLVN